AGGGSRPPPRTRRSPKAAPQPPTGEEAMGTKGEPAPAAAGGAARRGFIRTTSQAYAAALPVGGINVGSLMALTDLEPIWVILTIVAWLASPLIAGAASFLSIVSQGIPEEYAAAEPSPPGM